MLTLVAIEFRNNSGMYMYDVCGTGASIHTCCDVSV